MAVSELPGNPNAVWTVRRHVEGKKFAVSITVDPNSHRPNIQCQVIVSQRPTLKESRMYRLIGRDELSAKHE